MPDLQFDESRRRFLRNTAILTLLGCGVRPLLQKPSPVEPPAFIEPRRELIPLERELIEELKRLALDIGDPESQVYAITFVNQFIRNGHLISTLDEAEALGMQYRSAGVHPLDEKVYINYFVYKLKNSHPILIQGLMVHEGKHIEKARERKKQLRGLQRVHEYCVENHINMWDLKNPDGTWKKFPDSNFYFYQVLLLSAFLSIETEADAVIAEYNFYRRKLGDISGYIKDFIADSRTNGIPYEIILYTSDGQIDKGLAGESAFHFAKEKGLITTRLTWEELSDYNLKAHLHNIYINNRIKGAIRDDGSIDRYKMKMGYFRGDVHILLGGNDPVQEAIIRVFFVEKERGTMKFDGEGGYIILDPARFLDWLDTGIYVDENGDAIDLMKLDFTPDTHGVLPKLIPPFVIGITRESVNDIISRGGEIVKKIYPDLAGRIKDICPDWRPINIEDLCSIMTTGRLPLDWPELVSAMRLDGIIDEGDFSTITAIGTAVEEAAQGTALTVNDKALITEVIAIRYLLENAGELRDRLNSLGYGSKADRIILLLQGIKKNKPRHRTDYDFIKGLEKLTGNKLDDSGLNLADIRGNGENHLTRHWVNIFELNLKQWGVLELFNKRKPKGIIVQDIRDLGPGVQNWLEGIKRHNVDMSGVKMAYVTDGISDADRDKVAAVKPANVILVQNIEELRGQGENIVYLASRERLEPYVEQGLRLVERGNSGPVIELSWCLLMLSADDIRDAYKQFMDKLLDSGLITKEQIQELEDPFYIRLPNAEKVLEMWDELQEGSSYLDIWA